MPGSYRLQVRTEVPATGDKRTPQAAVAELDLEVPEMPDGRHDEPLDIGALSPRAAFPP